MWIFNNIFLSFSSNWKFACFLKVYKNKQTKQSKNRLKATFLTAELLKISRSRKRVVLLWQPATMSSHVTGWEFFIKWFWCVLHFSSFLFWKIIFIFIYVTILILNNLVHHPTLLPCYIINLKWGSKKKNPNTMQTTVNFIKINSYHCMQHTPKPKRKHLDQLQQRTLTQPYVLTARFGGVTP